MLTHVPTTLTVPPPWDVHPVGLEAPVDGKTYPRLIARVRPPVGHPLPIAVYVQVKVGLWVGMVVFGSRPQSFIFTPSRYLSTTRRARSTEAGTGFDGLSRSLAGAAAGTRAPFLAALVTFCFKVKAPLKSKIPTTNASSKGRETANSTICAARASDDRRRARVVGQRLKGKQKLKRVWEADENAATCQASGIDA